ncbi:hypothetical protein EYW98_19235 [Escherichia coli]|uniref:Uncharacterized protein n=2 Tax=Escherichia coli TaxID=562 RepID=A0A6D0DLA2_ECOLX|nr:MULTISPECIES: hypothetical protein [Escherichia]EFA2318396.1 hypothetical protein [Escherichia coli]EFJ8928261.1 hypothetical protein [Escherichia coli]EFM8967019.1 hypothetical protein [Escherichia coli]EFN7370413.1 hypothetical protein [Escherichia coli]EGO8361505.1 hypothetical protein [Escherichia coli]
MDEYFVNITPTSLSFKNVDLSDLSYKNARLELTLICPTFKSELKISFDWIHSFRVTDEGDLLGMSGMHGISQTGIYRVVNSAYFAWFTMQSCEIHKNKMIEHYVIATSNDVIDVLSTVSPQIVYD